MSQSNLTIEKKDKNVYLGLITFILQHIRDVEKIKRIYQFAQELWVSESESSPGG